MFVFLPKVLRQVLVRASGNLRQQAILPLLQQLEDKERGPQMPLIFLFIYLFRQLIHQFSNLPPLHSTLPLISTRM